MNSNLWIKNPQFIYDGQITLGTIFRVIDPLPMKTLMANDIPMLEIRLSVIVIKHPNILALVQVNTMLTGNVSQAFVLNGYRLRVHSSTPE